MWGSPLKNCTKKRAYTQPEATKAAQKYWDRNRKSYVPYQCDICKQYHLASKK